MIAGQLNEIIRIETPWQDPNAYSSEGTTQWQLKCKTRAKVVDNGGSRTVSHDEVVFHMTITVTVRHYIKPTNFDRIVWKSRYYEILHIEEKRHEMCNVITASLIDE